MPAKASRRRNARSRSNSKRPSRRWVAGVKTVSTFPPEGLFTKDAATIARFAGFKEGVPQRSRFRYAHA